jgi:acyl phosphate:glycerol-3-phosphate acyltransferase
VAVTLLALAAAYLIGAIPVGLLVARLSGGADIRGRGSGNIGATNVLRTLGPAAAALTLAGDVVKGYFAVVVARALEAAAPVAALAAVLAVAGNCWPVYLRFRGGKGVATGLGAFLALIPWAVLPSAVVWAVATGATRYVSLGSVAACLALPVAAALLGYAPSAVAAAMAVAAIIVWRHRENIRRLRAGTERRLGPRAAA